MIYKYCIQEDVRFFTQHDMGQFENEWLKLNGNEITIFGSHMNGYAWDGCSPKWNLLDLYLGTADGVVTKFEIDVVQPDGSLKKVEKFKPKTWEASLIHDILYQFKDVIPVSRLTADTIFYERMVIRDFKPAPAYRLAVRGVGWTFGEWKTKD